MKCIPKYMQKKLVRKIAYQLWRYEVDKESSSDFERYSKCLKQQLFNFLGTEISSEKYWSILEIYSKLGYLPNHKKLEYFLYKRLLNVLVASIKEDKLHHELDD
jgi:hypothetical protein